LNEPDAEVRYGRIGSGEVTHVNARSDLQTGDHLWKEETIQETIDQQKKNRLKAIEKAIEEGNPNWTEEQCEAAKEVVKDFAFGLKEEFKQTNGENDE